MCWGVSLARGAAALPTAVGRRSFPSRRWDGLGGRRRHAHEEGSCLTLNGHGLHVLFPQPHWETAIESELPDCSLLRSRTSHTSSRDERLSEQAAVGQGSFFMHILVRVPFPPLPPLDRCFPSLLVVRRNTTLGKAQNVTTPAGLRRGGHHDRLPSSSGQGAGTPPRSRTLFSTVFLVTMCIEIRLLPEDAALEFAVPVLVARRCEWFRAMACRASENGAQIWGKDQDPTWLSRASNASTQSCLIPSHSPGNV